MEGLTKATLTGQAMSVVVRGNEEAKMMSVGVSESEAADEVLPRPGGTICSGAPVLFFV